MVGPFIFFDQIGPATFIEGTGIDVRPHPHIGLSTVTYLFRRGQIFHRDSLGVRLPSSRVPSPDGRARHRAFRRCGPQARASGQRMFGIQSWMALPKSHEEVALPSCTSRETSCPASKAGASACV